MRHMQFIESYKKLENAISGIETLDDRSVVGFENAMMRDSHELNMLRYCRYTRNYIQHNTDYETFVSVTPGMISFLRDETEYALSLQKRAGDIMVKAKSLPKDADIVAIAKALRRVPIAVITEDGKVTAAYDEQSLHDAVIAGKPSRTVSARIAFVGKDEPMKNLHGACIVTDTGTRKGKYLGVVKAQ